MIIFADASVIHSGKYVMLLFIISLCDLAWAEYRQSLIYNLFFSSCLRLFLCGMKALVVCNQRCGCWSELWLLDHSLGVWQLHNHMTYCSNAATAPTHISSPILPCWVSWAYFSPSWAQRPWVCCSSFWVPHLGPSLLCLISLPSSENSFLKEKQLMHHAAHPYRSRFMLSQSECHFRTGHNSLHPRIAASTHMALVSG